MSQHPWIAGSKVVRLVEGLLIVLFFVLQKHIWFSDQGLRFNESLVDRWTVQERAVQHLERQNRELSQHLRALQGDLALIEERARSMSMARSHEVLYRYTGVPKDNQDS